MSRMDARRSCAFIWGGAAPGARESHFAFPLAACRGNAFSMRGKVGDGEREDVCVQLAAEGRRLEVGWAAGDKSGAEQWVPGRPVRLSLGGVGSGRMLGMTPEPVLWPTWQAVANNHRNVWGL